MEKRMDFVEATLNEMNLTLQRIEKLLKKEEPGANYWADPVATCGGDCGCCALPTEEDG